MRAYGAVDRRVVEDDDGAAVVIVDEGPEVADGVLKRPLGDDVLARSRVALPDAMQRSYSMEFDWKSQKIDK